MENRNAKQLTAMKTKKEVQNTMQTQTSATPAATQPVAPATTPVATKKATPTRRKATATPRKTKAAAPKAKPVAKAKAAPKPVGGNAKYAMNKLVLIKADNPFKPGSAKHESLEVLRKARNRTLTWEQYKERGGRNSHMRSAIKRGFVKATQLASGTAQA